jgi:hypothetical protein
MKIGLSYSRCIRDIVDGKVDINDVLVLITRTDFDPRDDEQWAGIWTGYGGGQTFGSPFSSPEWMDYPAEDEAKFRDVSVELYSSGKMHQPRKFGAHPHRLPYYWLETVVSDKDLEKSPTVKDAWNKFQMISGLKGTPLKAHNE